MSVGCVHGVGEGQPQTQHEIHLSRRPAPRRRSHFEAAYLPGLSQAWTLSSKQRSSVGSSLPKFTCGFPLDVVKPGHKEEPCDGNVSAGKTFPGALCYWAPFRLVISSTTVGSKTALAKTGHIDVGLPSF